jgi:arylsulfatase A
VPPNIVLIVADDLGYGDLGCSGNPLARTPNIDTLAGSGATLNEHYSGSPVCSPARAALLTGRYPHRTGVIDTREVRGLSRLSTREVTLADRLKMAGYVTALIGKWHLGSVGARYAPQNRGFDEFVGFLGGSSDYWDYWLSHNGDYVRSDGSYLTDRLTVAATDFIARHHQRPFFLEIAYNAPHSPLQAPKSALDDFEALTLSEEVKTIYAMIAVMDAGVGRVLQALDDFHIADDTIVIFTSDNGPDMSGSPQLGGEPKPELVRFNAGLRGSKGVVFDGGVRVPALVRWPSGLGEKATTVSQPTHFVDWTPTILEACSLSESLYSRPAPALDGHSFMGLLRGDDSGGRSQLAWQWNRYAPLPRCNAALRRGPWKLVWPALEGSMHAFAEDSAADRRLDDPRVQPRALEAYSPEVFRKVAEPAEPLLFDLSCDPGETSNLAPGQPSLVRELIDDLDAWFADVRAEWRSVIDAGLCD